MSGERTAKRNAAKVAYRKLAESWRKEKAYQAWATKNGIDLPPGSTKLGRKPTFNQWLHAVKKQSAFTASPETIQDYKEEVNLDWEEEEAKVQK